MILFVEKIKAERVFSNTSENRLLSMKLFQARQTTGTGIIATRNSAKL